MYNVLLDIVFRNYSIWLFIIIAILIVFGLVHATSDRSAQVSDHKNSGSTNVLLYLGSFFIVGSMFLLAKDEPDLLPIILIAVSILCYSAGILIYRFVDYLKPVGLAFTYSSIVLFPLWHYAFEHFNLDASICSFLSITVSLLAFVGAAVGIRSKVAGWLSYLWLIMFGWSAARAIDSAVGENILFSYAFYVWPLLIAFIPNLLWQKRVKWLPVAFRQATKALADVLTPIFLVLLLSTLFVPHIGRDYPALRATSALLGLGNMLISWAFSKKRSHFVLVRICTQALLIFTIADITDYASFGSTSDGAIVAVLLTWIATFLIQALVSLFIPQTTESEKNAERTLFIVSLIGIAISPMLGGNLPAETLTIIGVATSSAIAALGVAAAAKFKNLNWAIATTVGLSLIPIIINVGLSLYMNNWILFTIEAAITAIAIAIFGVIHSMNRNQGLGFAIATTIIGGCICLGYSSIEGWSCAGLLYAAIMIAAIAAMTRRRGLLEASVYVGIIALAYLVQSICFLVEYGTPKLTSLIETFLSSSSTWSIYAIFSCVESTLMSVALFSFALFKDRDKIASPRMIIGFILLALTFPPSTFERGTAAIMVWSVIYIVLMVAMILVGAITTRKWLVIAGIIAAVLTALDLTGGFGSALSLFIIGVAIIGIVIWQLSSNRNKIISTKPVEEEPKKLDEGESNPKDNSQEEQ